MSDVVPRSGWNRRAPKYWGWKTALFLNQSMRERWCFAVRTCQNRGRTEQILYKSWDKPIIFIMWIIPQYGDIIFYWHPYFLFRRFCLAFFIFWLASPFKMIMCSAELVSSSWHTQHCLPLLYHLVHYII